ncbi:hypothetical protein FO519_008152 [Halicephalobus sp. NKZ332]|nr:hypothetical protein FO519_008152 [Halicephalobus sp. NKZ332]
MLMPGVGGLIAGPLGKLGGSKMACYFLLSNCLLTLFTIVGMTMSLVYRYTSIFPGVVKKIGTSKWMIVTGLIIQLLLSILICFVAGKFLSIDHDTIVEKAIEFSPVLSRFANEPTFIMIDKNFGFPIIIVTWAFLLIMSTLFIIVAMALIFEMTRNTYTSNSLKLQKALILSCIVQIGITFVFLFIPVMVFFYHLTFGYVYAGPISMIFLCIVSLHAIIEMLATTYFVLPYRKFVLRKLFNVQEERNNTISLSVANTYKKTVKLQKTDGRSVLKE